MLIGCTSNFACRLSSHSKENPSDPCEPEGLTALKAGEETAMKLTRPPLLKSEMD